MLLTSETCIRPQISWVYVRLLLLLSTLSLAFILHAVLAWPLKCILIISLIIYIFPHYQHKCPQPDIAELRVTLKRWVILNPKGQSQQFDSATILLHNPLFQLIRLNKPKGRQYVVLFYDQLSQDEQRLLYIKANLKQVN